MSLRNSLPVPLPEKDLERHPKPQAELTSRVDSSGLSKSLESNSSNVSIESEDSQHELLMDAEDKGAFLRSTVFLLVIYFAFPVGIIAWALLDGRSSKIFFRQLGAQMTGWILIGGCVFLKLIFGLAGRYIRFAVKLAYLLDLIGITIGSFCMYFYFDLVWQEQYLFYGIYVLITLLCLLASSIGLYAGLIFTKRSYSPVVAFILMAIFSGGIIAWFMLRWDSTLVRNSKLFTILAFVIIADLYLAYEIRQIMKYRGHKFYTTDSALAFFSLWTDWFSYFWLDSLKNTKIMKKLKKKREQKKKTSKPVEAVEAVKAQPEQIGSDVKSIRPISDLPFEPSIRESEFDRPLDS